MTCCSTLPFSVTPLGEKHTPGVMITGLTPEGIADGATHSILRSLWQAHGVVVFRGLNGTDTHLDLSRVFGTLTAHPSRTAMNSANQELSDIGYTADNGNLIMIDGQEIGAFLPWHSDLVYFAEINRGGILRAIEPSRTGGMTGFVDKVAAWARLPGELKARCAGLWVTYWGDFRIESSRYARGAVQIRSSRNHQQIVAKRDHFPVVAHPLVCAHPGTGETMLNFSPWFATGIEGMNEAAAFALLDELYGFIDDPVYAYFHRWQPEDMVLWDNWRMLHSSTGVPADDRRIMQRTTIMGDYGLGKVLTDTPQSVTLERISV